MVIKAGDKLGQEDVEEAEQDRQAQALGGGDHLHLRADWVGTRKAFGELQAILAKTSIRQNRLFWDENHAECVHT